MTISIRARPLAVRRPTQAPENWRRKARLALLIALAGNDERELAKTLLRRRLPENIRNLDDGELRQRSAALEVEPD